MRAFTLSPPAFHDDHPDPVRAPGEALLAVRVAGVCDTDLQLAQGYMGFSGIPGHEFVATVVEADTARWRGRRVVADINAGCGHCDDCRAPRFAGHHCSARSVLGILKRGGAFADRLVVPERCLYEVPASLADEVAVFAEPVAAALHVEDELAGQSRARIAVLGDGKLGLLIALALKAAGHDVALVGRHLSKLAIAEAAGITTGLEREARDRFERRDVVVDATGNPAGLSLALALARPRGTIVLKTTVAAAVPVDLSVAVVNELRLVGSRCGDMARALTVLAKGTLDPRPLIQARYQLPAVEAALERAATKGTLKVLIDVAS